MSDAQSPTPPAASSDLRGAQAPETAGAMCEEIGRFLAENEGRWADSTVTQYRYYLVRLARWLASEGVTRPGEVTTDHLRRWLADRPTWGASSRYMATYGCRHFLRFAVGQANSPAEALRLPRRPHEPQKTLREDEVLQLFAACDTSVAKGIRDAALLAIMLDCGLRAAEICALELQHVDVAGRTLAVLTKGSKWQQKVFSAYAAGLLAEWLMVRPRLARRETKALFVGVGGLKPGTPMTRHGLRSNLYRLGVKAGIGPVMPHALRRTFATLAFRAGGSSRLIQVQGGWSSIRMVEVYSQALEPHDFDRFSPVERVMGLTRARDT
jgi:site-specific recombinase XerD